MSNDNKMLNLLMKVAETSTESCKLACAITIKKNILAFGVNSNHSDTFQARFSNHPEKIYRHAEISAIKRVINRYNLETLKKATLYVVRIRRPYRGSRDWVYGNSKPCSGCQKAIKEFGIKKVIFTTNFGWDELK